MRRAVWLAVAVALVGVPAWAADDVATEPLALRYEAPAACPDATAFFGQLRARTARVRAPKDGEKARALVVRVATAGRGFVGHIHFEDGGVSTSPRVVEAASCGEVIEALGLSAALAVDPTASTAPAASLAATPDAGAEPTANVTVNADASSFADAGAPPAPAADASAELERERERGRARDEEGERRAPESAGPRNTRFGAGVAVEAAVLSSFVPSGRVFAEITLRERAQLWSPSVRGFFSQSLGIEQVPSPSIGTATLTWTTGGIDLCPIRVHLAYNLALRPCAEVAAGSIAAESQGFAGAKDRSKLWMTAGLHGRLAWEPLSFLALEIEGGARLPFFRDSFRFLEAGTPGAKVYQAPSIGFFGAVGASVRFP